MRLLFCTTVLPTDRRTGSEIASHAFIDALRAAGHVVDVLGYRRPGASGGPAANTPASGREIVAGTRPIETDRAGARALWWMGASLATGRAYSSQKYVSGAYLAALRRWCEAGEGLVLYDHAQLAWLLQRRPACRPAVFVAHNIEHRLYQARARESTQPKARVFNREAIRIEAAEQTLGRAARQVWALTEHDASYFCEHGGQARAFEIPARPILVKDDVAPDLDLLLFGTWTWAANRAGLRWFLKEVRPRLPAGLTTHVAGLGAEVLCEALPGVVCHGFVPDLSALLARARVLVVPSVSGEGIQIKTLDALATGRPVVVTPIGLRGIRALPDRLQQAETPEAFARAIVQAQDQRADAAKGERWARVRRERFEQAVAAAIDEVISREPFEGP